jgi:hypothetical protein
MERHLVRSLLEFQTRPLAEPMTRPSGTMRRRQHGPRPTERRA